MEQVAQPRMDYGPNPKAPSRRKIIIKFDPICCCYHFRIYFYCNRAQNMRAKKNLTKLTNSKRRNS